MNFNGKSYDNVQFTSIGENKEREWSHYCPRIDMNLVFTQISEKKGIKIFKQCAVADILKQFKQLDYINVVVLENLNVLTPENHLEL